MCQETFLGSFLVFVYEFKEIASNNFIGFNVKKILQSH